MCRVCAKVVGIYACRYLYLVSHGGIRYMRRTRTNKLFCSDCVWLNIKHTHTQTYTQTECLWVNNVQTMSECTFHFMRITPLVEN